MGTSARWWADGWEVEIRAREVLIRLPSGEVRLPGTEADQLSVQRRLFRWQVVLHQDPDRRLRGLPKSDALTLRAALAEHLADVRRAIEDDARRERATKLRDAASADLAALVGWHREMRSYLDDQLADRRWISHDRVRDLAARLPASSQLAALAADDDARALLSSEQRDALTALTRDHQHERRQINERIARRELTAQRSFLDTIEKSPLTDEQARAVLCFDNRVQVIAAAGSGKTSVMVARAAYAIKRGFVPASRILVLAFNANAATELQDRIDARLAANGIDATDLRASTFHSYGLSVIGQATAEKPRLAPWVDSGQDLRMVERIVDELRDSSLTFRYKWDLYRMLFARTGHTPEGGDAEWWDRDTDVTGHRTLGGETVRSQGEKLIADWLFLNGVTYEYEREYTHPVADADHAQYRPDFYYPDIDAWHEHWALGRDGRPPESFTGYAEGMAWKQRIHHQYGTTLIETTWAEILDRSGFEPLEQELRRQGLDLDWNPDRPLPAGARPVKHEELAQLVRSFMSHVKSNSLDRGALAHRLAEAKGVNRYRARIFLDLYWDIHDAWETRLRAEGYVDFEDMLVRAAEALETGEARSAYDLILVDEFQDSSAARARLVGALINKPDTYLLAVGDDWQSIYRFAGSDVSVMTDFEEWFGPSETLRLQTTFRSTQAITDVASTFVGQNPRQLRKAVRSAQGPGGAPVVLATVTPSSPNQPDAALAAAVDGYLRHLASRIENGEVEPSRDGRVSVDVLGRYRFEEGLLPRRMPSCLDVTFRTVHRSKGLEADYVLIPRMIRGTVGFPSQIEDDPILDLVIADTDPYPHGEERRLLYVALTRARREATLLTVAGRESPFVVELLKNGLIKRLETIGAPPRASSPNVAVCPKCREGLLVPRRGKYGEFWACARFPACRHTQNRSPE